MEEVTKLTLTSKRVHFETIERYRIDIPDGCTEDEKAHRLRELAMWYNHMNPDAAENGDMSATEAIQEGTDEDGRFFWFSAGMQCSGRDMNKMIYKNVLDTEVLTR